MCGFFAFSTGKSAREIADIFSLTNLPSSYADLKSDIFSLKHFPKSLIPTISQNSPNLLVMRYWSLIPRWWKQDLTDLKFSTFNARSEVVATKATYRTPWQSAQRCLIPSTWFYEFQTLENDGRKYKQPFKVFDPDTEILTLAGLYEEWQSPSQQKLASVTIITCQSVGELATIHHRQPVIIKEEDRQRWLSKQTSPSQASELLGPEPNLKVQAIDKAFNKSFGQDVTQKMLNGSSFS